MAVFAGSRYEGVPTATLGTRVYLARSDEQTGDYPFSEYYTLEGERVDELASRFLGNPHDWWRIANLNPEVRDFLDIPTNTRLRIPDVRR